MMKKYFGQSLLGIVCIGLLCSAMFQLVHAGEKLTTEQFISPEVCSDCHSEIYDQWQNSMHNLSHLDPLYEKISQFLRKGLIENDEIKEADSCVKCHTPIGFVTGFPKKISDDLEKSPAIAKQGIQCDYCHSAVSIKQIHNNGIVLNPGQGEDDPGIKYGPFDDAEPDFHEAEFSQLHTESQFCGTCHNVKHVVFGTDLETTYSEWEKSPYNSIDPEKRIGCQECHMYQQPGIPATGMTERPENPGAATDYSEERPHIFTHYFVGGNSSVPSQFGDADKSVMAKERLQHAATLSIDTSQIEDRKLDIIITNSGAGHSIPTGVGDLRQVWLEINIKDTSGKTLFISGALKANGELEDKSRLFRTVFGDGNGKAVVNIAKAREVLSDNRIKAKEKRIETIVLPAIPQSGSIISVKLLYRSIPQTILNMIPDETFEPLPIIEMAKIQISI